MIYLMYFESVNDRFACYKDEVKHKLSGMNTTRALSAGSLLLFNIALAFCTLKRFLPCTSRCSFTGIKLVLAVCSRAACKTVRLDQTSCIIELDDVA